MRKRSGLVSYGGDSEISDSEDERTSISISPPGFQNTVPTNSLGIPGSIPRLVSSPPTLPKPVIEAAPTTSLVDYGDEDHNDSKGDNSVTFDKEASVSFTNNDESETITEFSPRMDELPAIEVTHYASCNVPIYLDTKDVLLPQEPSTKCSKALQTKIINLLQKRASSGLDLNASLKQRKDLRNPSIYEKLVQFCNLDEFGTNYPEHLYDPKEWTEESFYDNLFKDQKKEYMKKEKAKLDRTTVEFVTGTKRPSVSGAATKTEPPKKPRRSKWDIGCNSGPESGGSRGTSPTLNRPPLLGSAPAGMQPRVLQTGVVGAQARAQANQLNKELYQKLHE